MPEVLISDHARMEMARRDLPQESPDSRPMLVRVVVIEEGDALVVITAYRTSRIAKYWQAETNP
jgi:hypothetical protein